MTDSVHVMVRISSDVAELIDTQCGGKSGGGRGIRNGRSVWIQDIIHRSLGLQPPEKYVSKPLPNMAGIDPSGLDVKNRLIVSLYQAGHDLPAITKILTEREIPPPRKGSWTTHNVKQALFRAYERTQNKKKKPKRVMSNVKQLLEDSAC